MQPSAQSTASKASRPERAALLSGFLLTGVIAVVLGPLIPELESVWGIDHGQSGSLFLVQFAASSVGAILSSFNLRRSLVAGYALVALSLFMLVTGGWPLARLAMAINGFSLGLMISGSNLLVARKNPETRGASLATLNLVWGLGAVSSPLLFAATSQSLGAFGLLRVLAILAFFMSVVVGVTVRNPIAGAVQEPAGSEAASPRSSSPGQLSLVAALMFFYVGIEMSIGGWLVTLSDQIGAERSILSLIIASGFWGAILSGRAMAAVALRRLSETSVYWASLGVAVAGATCLFVAESRAVVAAGAVLAGLGLAALYPLTVSVLAEATAGGGARLGGSLMAFGGFGGALLPWLTGRLSQASGPAGQMAQQSLSRGFLIPLAGLAILAILFQAYRVTAKAPETAS